MANESGTQSGDTTDNADEIPADLAQDICQACCKDDRIDMECWQLLLPSLLAIESNSPPPENHYNDIRIAVEYGLRFLHAYGILPPNLIENDKVNLGFSSRFLSGMRVDFKESGDSVNTRNGNPLPPKLIADGLHFVLGATQPASHSDTAINLRQRSIVAVENEVPQHHILQSITYMTVDFIQWCINFVLQNPDRAENSNLWNSRDLESYRGPIHRIDEGRHRHAWLFPVQGKRDLNIRISEDLQIQKKVNLSRGQFVEVLYLPNPDGPFRHARDFELIVREE